MYFANYETDPACVPYLSDSYIDSTCEELINRFDPQALNHLHPVNIEQFITRFLGLNLEFDHLSCNGSVLGANVVQDTDLFPVYDPESGRAVFRSALGGTVFADLSLKKAGMLNRCRFTLAHEAGHALWHGMYYRALIKEGKARRAYLSCTPAVISQSSRQSAEKMSRHDLIERQANRTASALLMPSCAVKRLISTLGECRTKEDLEDRIIITAGTFRVSDEAARIRLEEMGLLPEIKTVRRIVRVY